MKWDRFQAPSKTTFIAGDWNAIDDISGMKVKASTISKQWDGFRTQTKNISQRHPQDFLRGTKDRIRTPWNRGEAEDQFVNS